eukprot:1180357-Prorocentrum_minimum.AAC.1
MSEPQSASWRRSTRQRDIINDFPLPTRGPLLGALIYSRRCYRLWAYAHIPPVIGSGRVRTGVELVRTPARDGSVRPPSLLLVPNALSESAELEKHRPPRDVFSARLQHHRDVGHPAVYVRLPVVNPVLGHVQRRRLQLQLNVVSCAPWW